MEEKTNDFPQNEYNRRIEELREKEYPALKGVTYLDHGGSTIPAKSLLDEVAADLSSNLYGNPHSACTPAELSGRRVDETREQALRFFNADPEHFDLVFVANATAAMKLVMDALKDHCDATRTLSRSQRRKFWYGYHRDAHNSLIGIREAASGGHHCFDTDAAVDAWIAGAAPATNPRQHLRLFAYPGQSNMTGRRLPPAWPSLIRTSPHTSTTFTLLDAAALATTSPLPLHDPTTAPDFTTLSFYKIFGFPDLGALLIRRTPATTALLTSRRYFAGGTVDMVTSHPPQHARKPALHSTLEDGTLPFHNIVALGAALTTHTRLFLSAAAVSAHTAALTARLHAGMAALRHASGAPLVAVYNEPGARFGDPAMQGATIAFNVRDPAGAFVAPGAVERAADARGVFLRSGSLCNPGGAARYLGWSAAELWGLYEEGLRCSRPAGVVGGRPTGVVRVSLGAGSTVGDVDAFLGFLREVCVDRVVGEEESLAKGEAEAESVGEETVSAGRSVVEGKRRSGQRRRGMRRLIMSCFTGGGGEYEGEKRG